VERAYRQTSLASPPPKSNLFGGKIIARRGFSSLICWYIHEYSGTKPTKPADDDYGYVFTGWDKATSVITGDVTAMAQYSKANYLDYILSADESYYIVYKSTTATLPETVAIPSEYKSLPVKAIGASAFQDTALKKVIISDSVETIGEGAFMSCHSLTSIDFSSSITSIGNSAFQECYQLQLIDLPTSLTSLGSSVFYYCRSLSSLIIPSSVTSIGENAFGECPLVTMAFPNSLTSLSNQLFFRCSALTSVAIPSSVTEINNGVFYGCTSLQSIVLPASLKILSYGAFSDCSSLESIAIPSSVVTIRDCAFENCTKLTSVNFEGTMAAFKSATEGFTLSSIFRSTRVQYVQCSDGKVTLS
jgi:hypothetical protein